MPEGVDEAHFEEFAERLTLLGSEGSNLVLSLRIIDIDVKVSDIQVPCEDERLPCLLPQRLKVSLEVSVPLLYSVIESLQVLP